MEINDTLILLSLTQTEINAITSPDVGGMLYNSTTNTVQIFDGSAWENSTITDTDDIPEGSINLYYTDVRVAANTAVALNTAKLTNATHTGEVTGSGALTVAPTAISNKASVTAASGMEILVNDAGTLKKADASDFLGGGGSGLNPIETATLDGTIITPTELTNDAHNYNPTGFATCVLIRQSISSNGIKITGFPAPAAAVNRIVSVSNISVATRDIRFEHNDSNSTAANRLYLRDFADRTIRPNETAIFWYDHDISRWRSYNRIG